MHRQPTRPGLLWIVSVFLVLALIASACGDDDGDVATDEGATDTTAVSGEETEGGEASGDPLIVGVSLSLTGDFSDNGQAAQIGYELWRDVVNENGGLLGRPVEIRIVDDASSPEQVVTNYENFITRENVDLVFGPYSSLLNLPAGQVAERNGFAFIEGMGNGPSVFEECLETLIYAGTAASDTSAGIWGDYVLSLPEDEQPQTAAYVSLDDPFSAPAAQLLQERFEEAGIETVYSEIYSTETTDLTPLMQAVASADPDMVVSGSQTQDGWAQVRAMVQLGFNPDLLFMTNGPTQVIDFPANVGEENTGGIFTTDNWDPTLGTAGNAEFVEAYIEQHGGTAEEIDSTSAQAYAVGQMAQQLVDDVGEIDQLAIVEASRSGEWGTVVGDVSLGDCSVPSGTQPLFQWIDGQISIVYPTDLAQAEPIRPKPDWGGEVPEATPSEEG